MRSGVKTKTLLDRSLSWNVQALVLQTDPEVQSHLLEYIGSNVVMNAESPRLKIVWSSLLADDLTPGKPASALDPDALIIVKDDWPYTKLIFEK